MLWRGRRRSVTELTEHPNLEEITGIVGQIPLLEVEDLYRLGDAWSNTSEVTQARSRALGPDCPLVLDVLRTFESITSAFTAVIADADRPHVASVGLKGLRDAVAGSFARPALTRREYKVLLRPWRTAFPLPRLESYGLGTIAPYF